MCINVYEIKLIFHLHQLWLRLSVMYQHLESVDVNIRQTSAYLYPFIHKFFTLYQYMK